MGILDARASVAADKTYVKVSDVTEATDLVTTSMLASKTEQTAFQGALDRIYAVETAAGVAHPSTTPFTTDFAGADTARLDTNPIGTGWAINNAGFYRKTNQLAFFTSSTANASYVAIRTTPALAGSLLSASLKVNALGTISTDATKTRTFSLIIAADSTTPTQSYEFGFSTTNNKWQILRNGTLLVAAASTSTPAAPYTMTAGIRALTGGVATLFLAINGTDVVTGSDSAPLTGRYYGVSVFGDSGLSTLLADDYTVTAA